VAGIFLPGKRRCNYPVFLATANAWMPATAAPEEDKPANTLLQMSYGLLMEPPHPRFIPDRLAETPPLYI
jgi:hypothetical protein